jgi:hypothetical protein
MVFVFTAIMFILYDRLVERRQHIVLNKAATSTAIVSSLFPKNVRDRLMQVDNNQENPDKTGDFMAPHHRLKSFLTNKANSENDLGQKPIADLFPHTTVLFADISGFTAWSSTREPAQVFILLQTLYQSFDVIAKKRKVFKVETLGDSYVAVTGLPEPQERHAVIMARFAGECMLKLQEIVTDLEVTLGPDTGDLSMRVRFLREFFFGGSVFLCSSVLILLISIYFHSTSLACILAPLQLVFLGAIVPVSNCLVILLIRLLEWSPQGVVTRSSVQRQLLIFSLETEKGTG